MTAVSTWWNPANYLDAKVAESRMIRRFIDEDVFHCQIRDIPIDYNPETRDINMNVHGQPQPQHIHTLSFNLRDSELR